MTGRTVASLTLRPDQRRVAAGVLLEVAVVLRHLHLHLLTRP
eukprot:COSAG01_NODE_5508_length_4212_cov_27.624449_3_plen_42_part_00